MKLPRRAFLHLAAGAAALPTVSRVARAQAYPTRPVRWIVPYPPGGAADPIARLIGPFLSERLGKPVMIENKPGAGANIGTEFVVRSPPDGHTLLFITTANMINATFYRDLSFDFMRDITPVAGLVRLPLVLEINPSVPVKTVAELIAYAKANPGKVNFASAGVGTSLHLAAELFNMMTGTKMIHVPYRGSAPALTDLLAGQVQVLFDNLFTSLEHIKAGKLRARCGDNRPRTAVARSPDGRRRRAGLRGELRLWCGRAHRYTARNYRAAESGARRCAGGPSDQGAAAGAHGDSDSQPGSRVPC